MTAAPIEFPAGGIDDGVIRLRLQTEADMGVMVAAMTDEAIQRYTTVPSAYAERDAVGWLRESDEQRESGMALSLTVADLASNEPLGGVGARRSTSDPGKWAIGYLVYPQARRRGVATRSVRLIAGFAFEELEAERLEIQVEPANPASQRVAEAAGFTREGVLRAYQEIKGTRRDMVVYSLLPGELRSE